eukprot:IDg22585t1
MFFSDLKSATAELKSPDERMIHLTVFLNKDELNTQTPERKAARYREIQKSTTARIFKVIFKKDLQKNNNGMLAQLLIRNPSSNFNLGPDEILLLIEPIYELSESAKMRYETLKRYLREDLKMLPMKSDPALYCLKDNRELVGLNANYVEDLLPT